MSTAFLNDLWEQTEHCGPSLFVDYEDISRLRSLSEEHFDYDTREVRRFDKKHRYFYTAGHEYSLRRSEARRLIVLALQNEDRKLAARVAKVLES